MPKAVPIPKYRLHKASGQSFVQIKGRRHYLGKYGTPQSEEKYGRVIAELTANPHHAPAVVERFVPGDPLTVVQICAAYLDFAAGYYQREGKPTGSMPRVKACLRVLRRLYGATSAIEFGPMKLQAIQRHLADKGKSRRYVNHLTQAIRRIFKWAASQEMIPVSVHQSLGTVSGLRKGRTAAKELPRVQPVSDAVFQATLPWLPRVVSDMVRLQRLMAARPAEVCLIRPIDVDRSGPVWIYRPMSHKTDYRDGRERVILVGPKGQEILQRYLLRAPESFCFSPRESVEEFHAERRAQRQSPMTPSQRRRRRKSRPKLQPMERYTVGAYRSAIHRAVERANKATLKEAVAAGTEAPALLPVWNPGQLRHNAATEIRRKFGAEASQVVLGHAQLATSEIYAEKDLHQAAEIMRKIG